MNLSSCLSRLPLAMLALTGCFGQIESSSSNDGESETAGASPAELIAHSPDPTKRAASDPNDVWLAFGAGDGIHVVRADGSNLHRLELGMRASSPAFSPDGNSIAFAGPGGIWVHDFAAGKGQLVTRQGGDGTPAWSPDSRRIAFTRGLDVYVTDAKGLAEHAFMQGPPPGQAWYANYGHPAFAEGGRALIVGRRGGLDIGDPDGVERRTLFTTYEHDIAMMTVSPDGESIAIHAGCGLHATPLANAEAACEAVLLAGGPGPEVPPAWSTNELIAVADSIFSIRVVPAAGGVATTIVDTRQSLGGVYLNELSWSRPGTAVP